MRRRANVTIAGVSIGHVAAPTSEALDQSADPIPAPVQSLASSVEPDPIATNESNTDLAIYTQPMVLEGVIVSAPAADNLLQSLRKAADWCLNRFATARTGVAAWWSRMRYSGRHKVERRWYGRMRSTAEQTGIMHLEHRNHQTMRLTEASGTSEDDLCDVPLYWIGWAERFIEVMRDYDEALHPRTHHRFICS
jgi:hypothetical protein